MRALWQKVDRWLMAWVDANPAKASALNLLLWGGIVNYALHSDMPRWIVVLLVVEGCYVAVISLWLITLCLVQRNGGAA